MKGLFILFFTSIISLYLIENLGAISPPESINKSASIKLLPNLPEVNNFHIIGSFFLINKIEPIYVGLFEATALKNNRHKGVTTNKCSKRIIGYNEMIANGRDGEISVAESWLKIGKKKVFHTILFEKFTALLNQEYFNHNIVISSNPIPIMVKNLSTYSSIIFRPNCSKVYEEFCAKVEQDKNDGLVKSAITKRENLKDREKFEHLKKRKREQFKENLEKASDILIGEWYWATGERIWYKPDGAAEFIDSNERMSIFRWRVEDDMLFHDGVKKEDSPGVWLSISEEKHKYKIEELDDSSVKICPLGNPNKTFRLIRSILY